MHESPVVRAIPICGPPPFRHEHNTALHKRYTISTSMHGLPLRSSIRWSFGAITVGSAAGSGCLSLRSRTRARGGERRSTGAGGRPAVARAAISPIYRGKKDCSTSLLRWAFALWSETESAIAKVDYSLETIKFSKGLLLTDAIQTSQLTQALPVSFVYIFHHVGFNREMLFFVDQGVRCISIIKFYYLRVT